MTDRRATAEEPELAPDDVEERSSPSPYADDFSEWVADETAPDDDGRRAASAEVTR